MESTRDLSPKNADSHFGPATASKAKKINCNHLCFGPFNALPDIAKQNLDIRGFENPTVVQAWMNRSYAALGHHVSIDSDTRLDFECDRSPFLITRLSSDTPTKNAQYKAMAALVKPCNAEIVNLKLPRFVQMQYHLKVTSTENSYIEVDGKKYRALVGTLRPSTNSTVLPLLEQICASESIRTEILDMHDSLLAPKPGSTTRNIRVMVIAQEEKCDQLFIASQDLYDGGEQLSLMYIDLVAGHSEFHNEVSIYVHICRQGASPRLLLKILGCRPLGLYFPWRGVESFLRRNRSLGIRHDYDRDTGPGISECPGTFRMYTGAGRRSRIS
mmetsp:Transcript_29290/g.47283  ORF Transcript_29290/g.47283 Transcript_29290/m.47283 type:complete len:329 (+) Transcript_29290:383-1369(+)